MSGMLKRWWWAILLVAVVLGLFRLRFDVDVLNLLPPDEPTVRGLKLYQQYFSNARELVITLRASDPEKAEKLVSALGERLRRETNLLVSVSWQPPWMEDPGQLAELLGCAWLNQPPADFSALANRLAPNQLKPTLAQTKEELAMSMSPMDVARRAFDPYNLLSMPALTNLSGFSMEQGQQMFASNQGNFRLLFLTSSIDLTSYQDCERWLGAIRAIIDEFERTQPKQDIEGTVIHYTGRPAFVVEIATSMQHDLRGSVFGTTLIIAVLFWLTHRRWMPLLWLLTLLGLLLFATLALGGLLLGEVSVLSMGFAAVLLGLAVDYAVVHYQEALAHPQLSVPEIRRAIAPSILWAAITTMSAFLVLNLGGLPGLAQLGSLVALGVGLAAFVMVMIYLPPLFPGRRQAPPGRVAPKWWTYFVPPQEPLSAATAKVSPSYLRTATGLTVLLVLASLAVISFKRPGLDKSGSALRPQHSEAEVTLAEMTKEMGLPPEPLWLIVSGKNEGEVYRRVTTAEAFLNQAVTNHLIEKFIMPSALWPRPDLQAQNRATARFLGTLGPQLRQAALEEGFNTNALILTEQLVRTWARAGATTNVVWPTNQVSQWLLNRFVARAPNEWLLMGVIYPATNKVDAASLSRLSGELASHQCWLSGWELLGSATWHRVRGKLFPMIAPMVLLVLLSLWFAFRRPAEIFLGMGTLLLSGLCLLAVMVLCGWSWNLLNLMAVPLILGTGVDYTLFMQLALRRHGGDVPLVRRSIGRALMLCGGTAVAGFGSLGWSSNPGMASLGKVCAVGIGANMLFSVFLLPAWWLRATRRKGSPTGQNGGCRTSAVEAVSAPPSEPPRRSSFYRAGLWKLGLAIVGRVPPGLLKPLCVLGSEIHYYLRPERRRMVTQNLLPVLRGDLEAAQAATHRLYRCFAAKLVDLWRIENGITVKEWLTHNPELEIIRAARARGRGVLFLTLHLGNWEHGGLLLNQLGIPLTILTLAEPHEPLTQLRAELRARCGVDTLVIGQDSFALLEVIKKLQSGAALAIALDRPAERGGARVKFFGQDFEAPLAAAELARASGCALVGVTIVRRPAGYAVKVLPEFTYDRRELGNREARVKLTEQILRAFESEIRENIEQWYQFVPIWPQPAPP